MRLAEITIALVLVLAACSDSSKTAAPAPSGPAVVDAGSDPVVDAGGAADAAAPVVLTPTKATTAHVTIGGVDRTLERAQFGVTKADNTLYIEAHEGGAAACPEVATPNRTLIISGVPKGAPGARYTEADGITVTLIDFAGDQIASNPPNAKASTLTVTLVDVKDGASAEIEVDATFPNGSAKGRVYATYCEAISD